MFSVLLSMFPSQWAGFIMQGEAKRNETDVPWCCFAFAARIIVTNEPSAHRSGAVVFVSLKYAATDISFINTSTINYSEYASLLNADCKLLQYDTLYPITSLVISIGVRRVTMNLILFLLLRHFAFYRTDLDKEGIAYAGVEDNICLK